MSEWVREWVRECEMEAPRRHKRTRRRHWGSNQRETCVMAKRPDWILCWFRWCDDAVRGPGPGRELGKHCFGCGEWVRTSRMARHGLPSCHKKQRLSEEEERGLLSTDATHGVYMYASPFHARSQVLLDLVQHYGAGQHVTATTSAAHRIRPSGDFRTAV